MFNGTYTITNKASGEWRTFRIRTQAQDAKFAPGKRVVALLRGPDNESDFQGFAFVGKLDGRDRVWVWKRYTNDATGAFPHFAAMLETAAEALGEAMALEVEEAGTDFTYHDRLYHVQAAKRCINCNRKLTTPESLRRGYGPECAERLGIE